MNKDARPSTLTGERVAAPDLYLRSNERIPTRSSLLGGLLLGVGGGLTIAWIAFLGWSALWLFGLV